MDEQRPRPEVGMIAELGHQAEGGEWIWSGPYRIVAVARDGKSFFTLSGKRFYTDSPAVRWRWPEERGETK